jgi:uncharacterized protein
VSRPDATDRTPPRAVFGILLIAFLLTGLAPAGSPGAFPLSGAAAQQLGLEQPDAGQPDAGQPDAGQPDAGQSDAGQSDAGQPDAGQSDAGQSDAGQPDAGHATRADSLVAAAQAQVGITLMYDGAYVTLEYPGGDVSRERGVCSDVLVRAYRALGVDLQVLIHEDMCLHFDAYPQHWGLTKPDRNIDHRRVLNLMRFFERHGRTLPAPSDAGAYDPGDIVAWELAPGIHHIGLVSGQRDPVTGHPLIIHNVGAGARCEEFLFAYPIVGHYRY